MIKFYTVEKVLNKYSKFECYDSTVCIDKDDISIDELLFLKANGHNFVTIEDCYIIKLKS